MTIVKLTRGVRPLLSGIRVELPEAGTYDLYTPSFGAELSCLLAHATRKLWICKELDQTPREAFPISNVNEHPSPLRKLGYAPDRRAYKRPPATHRLG